VTARSRGPEPFPWGDRGEAILVVAGLAALVTALYTIFSRRPSWAGLRSQRLAGWVAIAGFSFFLMGLISGGASGSRSASAQPAPVSTPAPTTSVQLEADVAAKLKAREDAVVKSEADSAAKLKEREDAVAKREAAAAVKEIPAKTIGEGTWTVGSDVEPGTYKTTQALNASCYWAITRTGSNGGDIIQNANVDGGFPMVTLTKGQTFESSRCGDWAKQ